MSAYASWTPTSLHARRRALGRWRAFWVCLSLALLMAAFGTLFAPTVGFRFASAGGGWLAAVLGGAAVAGATIGLGSGVLSALGRRTRRRVIALPRPSLRLPPLR